MSKAIKVRAAFAQPDKFGFYAGQVRRNGDVFTAQSDELGSWMAPLEEEKPKARRQRVISKDSDE